MKSKLVGGLLAGTIGVTGIFGAAAAKNSSARGGLSSDVSGGTKSVAIQDPVLGLAFTTMTVPATWNFDGALLQQSSCVAAASPYFRESTPNGLTGHKLLPRFDWAWMTNSQIKPINGSDCLPFDKELPAAEVLKYMVGILQVDFVKDLAMPDRAEYLAGNPQAAQAGASHSSWDRDMARALVRYNINGIKIDEVLTVSTSCMEVYGTPSAPTVHSHNCSVFVQRTWAPQGKAETTFAMVQALPKPVANPGWFERWKQVRPKQISDSYSKMTAAAMKSSAAAFQRDQDTRQRQHQQFLATLQRGTDISMHRAAEIAKTNHRIADDWCDYSLDRQKRWDPATGEVTKDSSAYSYTWIDEFGQHYHTNDVNDNPNGRLKGNWNLATNVH
jgi:hypothetical protein